MLAEAQQRLVRSHTGAAPARQNECRNFGHAAIITDGIGDPVADS
jgi:hypothetical protein